MEGNLEGIPLKIFGEIFEKKSMKIFLKISEGITGELSLGTS